jgi:hypothetical protein
MTCDMILNHVSFMHMLYLVVLFVRISIMVVRKLHYISNTRVTMTSTLENFFYIFLSSLQYIWSNFFFFAKLYI